MYRKILIAVFVVSLVFVTVSPSTTSAEESVVNDTFELKLLDASDNDLTDPLFCNVVYHFDTYSDCNGTIFKMKAMYSLSLTPSKLMVISESGLYNISVKMEGATSWFAESGLRMYFTSEEGTFISTIGSDNDFYSYIKDSSTNPARIKPNVGYTITAGVVNDSVETAVPPESISDITITFEASLIDGYHQVLFISQGKTVESYMVEDNYVFQSTPVPEERSGYSFTGWFTDDGREVKPGFTVSPEDGDIIAKAEWDYVGGGSTPSSFPIIPIIVAAIVASLLLVAIIYRRKRYHE